jgi:hypothetical protein
VIVIFINIGSKYAYYHDGKKLEAEIAFKIHEIEARKTNFLKKNSKVKHDMIKFGGIGHDFGNKHDI